MACTPLPRSRKEGAFRSRKRLATNPHFIPPLAQLSPPPLSVRLIHPRRTLSSSSLSSQNTASMTRTLLPPSFLLALALAVLLFGHAALGSQPPNLPLPTAAEVAAAASASRSNTAPAARAVEGKTAPTPTSRAQVAAAADEGALAKKGAAAVAAKAPPSSPRPSSSALAADPAAPTKSRLHQLQFLGSHRSYHVALDGRAEGFLATPDGVAALAAAGRPAGADAAAAAAAPPSLATQAGALGVRQFHFDVWADPDGGAYAGWAAPKLGGAPGVRPTTGNADWAAPGFKVFADPDFDGHTACASLGDCLSQLASWSTANPSHSPITVFVSARDTPLLAGSAPVAGGSTLDGLLGRMSLTPGPASLAVPPRVDAALLKELDAEVAAAFGSPSKAVVVDEEVAAVSAGGLLLTPDALRTAAGASTGTPLGRAILARGGAGWPRVSALRGRIMVVLAPGPAGAHAAALAAAFPGLAGAALFTAAPSPAAAGPDDLFVDLAGGAPGEAPALTGAAAVSVATSAARRGFLVRARAEDAASAGALLAGGATFVETATPGGSIVLPVPRGVKGGVAASRCNPATSLNPDSAGIAAVGCGQLVADDGGAPAAGGGVPDADSGTVATASLADSDDAVVPLPPTRRANPTANTLIKGVPTVASGFGRRRLARATQLPVVSVGGDEEDEDDTARVSAKSVTIVENIPEAGPIPTHREKAVPRPAEVRAAAAETAEVGGGAGVGAGATDTSSGTVAVTSLSSAPPVDSDANTFDGDVYALAMPSLLG